MREFYQPEGHIWQQRSIRISIGRRQRRVRDRNACLTQNRQVQKRLVNTTLTNLLKFGGPSQT